MLSLRQPKHWASSGVTFIKMVWDSASRMAAQPAKLTAQASATTPIHLRVILIMFVDAILRAISRHHMGGSLMERSRCGKLAAIGGHSSFGRPACADARNARPFIR